MKVNLHGRLKDAVGESFILDVDSVEDALRALTLQLPNWPKDLLLEVPGFDTPEKITAKTNVEEIDILPALYGGGPIAAFIVGIAHIITVGLTTALGATLAHAVISIAVAMALKGIMSIFMKSPSVDKANDPDASKYLGNNKNTTGIGTPIKLAWGRVWMSPHFLSIQSNADNMVHAIWPTNPT